MNSSIPIALAPAVTAPRGRAVVRHGPWFAGAAGPLLGWSQVGLWPWLGCATTSGDAAGVGGRGMMPGRGGSDPHDSSTNMDPALPFYHEPVLLQEVLDALNPQPGMLILDATLGGGGHSEAILQRGANVVAIDQDPVAIAHATSLLRGYAGRFVALRGNFRHFTSLLGEAGITKVDAILADIGLSSRQIDDASRGISFQTDGPLDMRMNPDGPLTAADVVNTASLEEMVRIFREYGEEHQAMRIARAIISARTQKPLRTTFDLVNAILTVCPRSGPRHPATKVFQALRIHVNAELAALQEFLKIAPKWLKPGGRLAIISFHSLEDAAIKRAFRHHATPTLDAPNWPEPKANPDFCVRLLTRKPVEPSPDEVKRNPRSRSARLRAVERLPEPP